MSKQYIYFFPMNDTAFKVFFEYAQYLIQVSHYTPIFLLDSSTNKHIMQLDRENIEYYLSGKPVNGKINSNEKIRSGMKRSFMFSKENIKKSIYWLAATDAFIITDFFITLFQLIKNYYRIRQLFKEKPPVAVILYGDRHLGLEPAILRAVNDLQKPSIIIPVAVSDPAGGVYLRRGKRQYYPDKSFSLLSRLAKHLNPRWIFRTDQENIMFYPPGKALAGYLLRMISLNPWCIGGGLSSKIAVESEKVKRQYILLGVSEDKIIVTGHPSHDDLYERKQSKQELYFQLSLKYKFSQGKKIIIFSVPQMFEDKVLSWEEHSRILADILSRLNKLGFIVLLSLHPKCQKENYVFLEKNFRTKILEEKLNDVLPAADIFLATFSSTVQWAALCGIPAVVLDIYGANYNIFDYLKGTKVVKSIDEMSDCFSKFADEISLFCDYKQKQIDSVKDIAIFDGKCRQRILHLIEDLVDIERLKN